MPGVVYLCTQNIRLRPVCFAVVSSQKKYDWLDTKNRILLFYNLVHLFAKLYLSVVGLVVGLIGKLTSKITEASIKTHVIRVTKVCLITRSLVNSK